MTLHKKTASFDERWTKLYN